ncbi:hypothetical protein DOE76_09920 [Leifsonia sp. ku-ls]|nr:hypothetical protein DOE76_09920 [Leifsonia sp. ku-ls]
MFSVTPANASESTPSNPYGATVVDEAGLSGPLYLSDEEGESTLVGRDGKVGLTVNPVAAGCSWTNMTVPLGGAWYTSVDGCSLIGATNTATHLYKYEVDSNSKGNPCVQGRGYTKVGTSWSASYQAIGCGKSGSKTITIGNVITVSKVKAQSIGTTGTALVFQ